MNFYLINIEEKGKKPFDKTFMASSLEDCEDKIVRWIYDTWDYDFHSEEFVTLKEELKNYNIKISNIQENVD